MVGSPSETRTTVTSPSASRATVEARSTTRTTVGSPSARADAGGFGFGFGNARAHRTRAVRGCVEASRDLQELLLARTAARKKLIHPVRQVRQPRRLPVLCQRE
jgi:hypothetical protein